MRRNGVLFVVLAIALVPHTASAEPRADDDLDGIASFGVTIRHVPPAPAAEGAIARASGRTTVPPPGEDVSYSVVKQFVLATTGHSHLGYEVEVTPALDDDGELGRRRMAAGAQLVAGVRGDLRQLEVRAELAGGLRLFENDDDAPVLEARVRADLWLSTQITLGGALGKSLLDERDWVMAVYLAVYTAWRDPP